MSSTAPRPSAKRSRFASSTRNSVFAAPAFARIAPFALFIALVAAQPLLEGMVDTRWLVALRGLAVAVLLAVFWRRYEELREAPPAATIAAAILAGMAVFLLWINLDAPWMTLGESRPFAPVDGAGKLDPMLVALRLFGFVLVVPVMEELFWRSFLMRWIDRRDFLAADPRRATFRAFALSCALFAAEHSLWLAGLVAGAVYAGLYMRSRNLWLPILSHATTNAILAIWILANGHWESW